MAKTIRKHLTPEESRKKYGGRSLIIVGGATEPLSEELSKQYRAERKRFLDRLGRDIKEQFDIPKPKEENQSGSEKEENQ